MKEVVYIKLVRKNRYRITINNAIQFIAARGKPNRLLVLFINTVLDCGGLSLNYQGEDVMKFGRFKSAAGSKSDAHVESPCALFDQHCALNPRHTRLQNQECIRYTFAVKYVQLVLYKK